MLGKVERMATINDARLREILTGSPTVAVLGIHREPEKAAFYVPEYLHDEGYRVIGVNPEFKDETLFGEKVRSTLKEIGEPIDIVDVFRRPELIPQHVDDILAMTPRPRVVCSSSASSTTRLPRSSKTPASSSFRTAARSPTISASASASPSVAEFSAR